MKLSHICVLLMALSLTGCSTYRQFVPAPHEMAITPVSAKLPEVEEPSVHQTQNINLDTLKILMKTRGYVYRGYRVARSEYGLSESDIAMAAKSINASAALYFVVDKETVTEERNRLELGNALVGVLQSTTGDDYKKSVSKTQSKTKKQKITYYTYMITYWTKMPEKTADESKQFLLDSVYTSFML